MFNFSNVRESTLIVGSLEEVAVRSEGDPLLWEHNEQHGGLYFSNAPANTHEIIGRMFEAHQSVLGTWRPFESYISATTAILASGCGLLARGPRPLLEVYQASLHGVLDVYFAPSHMPAGGNSVMYFDDAFVIYESYALAEVA